MHDHTFNLVNSSLDIKSSGNISEEYLNDLNMPEGKSIAELLDDQEKESNKE